MRTTSTFMKSAAVLSVAGLALTACGDGDGDGGGSDAVEEHCSGEGDQGEITIGVFSGWEEGIAASELWNCILTAEGYDVTLEEAEAGPVFSGLASGDYDLNLDVWQPVTHASYIEDYGDTLEEYGSWYDDAELTIAVNEDAPIDSLEELADNADEFGNTIVGIESGAGLTGVTEDEVIPTYGLEDMDFTTSSTPAMLSELQTATDNDENIVVTLWHPHWAYEAFPIKDLEDPEGTLGDAETLSVFGREGFSDDHPEVAEWMENFEMDAELLYDLENEMFNEAEEDADYEEIVADWVSENQDYVDGLTEGGDGDDADGDDGAEDAEDTEDAEDEDSEGEEN